jgi:hypothetical protein
MTDPNTHSLRSSYPQWHIPVSSEYSREFDKEVERKNAHLRWSRYYQGQGLAGLYPLAIWFLGDGGLKICQPAFGQR